MPLEKTNSRRVRLFVSLAMSLAAHVLVLSVAPGFPAIHAGTTGMAHSRPPLVVSLPSASRAKPVPQALAVVPKSPAAAPAVPAAMEARTATSIASPQETAPAPPTNPSGLFPGPWYYTSRYLHRRPSPLKPIWPEYPAAAGNVRGHVVILLLLNEQGEIDQYRITEAEPAGAFEASVIDAFTRAKYAPGLITGYPVKSQLLAEVSFEPGLPPQAVISGAGAR